MNLPSQAILRELKMPNADSAFFEAMVSEQASWQSDNPRVILDQRERSGVALASFIVHCKNAIMRTLPTLCAALSFLLTVAVHAEDIYSVNEAPISSDEKRQQAIIGVREFRCNYTLPNGPDHMYVIVEAYVWGELRHRYCSSVAFNFGRTAGSVSLAWVAKEREMVTVVETGHPFSPFAKRQLIDPEDFDEPVDCWFFSKCEKSQGMIPLFGICGQRSAKMGSVADKFETPQEFVAVSGRAGARFEWVVYLYVQDNIGAGSPSFDDGK